MARTVQDDARERQIANYLGLCRTSGRAGPDAHDECGNPFELKSATKTGVTTARDVGPHTITEWRQKYWIVATGVNLESGFRCNAIYVAHPDDLEPRFRKIEQRLQGDWAHCESVLKVARDAHVSEESIKKVEYICSRGITLNNPKISLSLFVLNATQLDHSNPRSARLQLANFVRRRPLRPRVSTA
jgi:hypothetical protein